MFQRKKSRKLCASALSVALSVAGCSRSASDAPAPLAGRQPQSMADRAAPVQQRPGASAQTASATPLHSEVVARVGGRAITMRQLQQPLIEAYGLNVLLNLVQLELAKERAQRAKVSPTEAEIGAERSLTMKRLFPDAEEGDYAQLMEQFLQQQRISATEFDIVLTTNAYLRKLATPLVEGKVSEANVEEAFRQQYGETAQVRHIQLANMTEIVEAKRRLSEGELFQDVARTMSRNARTRALGGELPPFSRATTGFPEAFREAAFSLKVGEVSDPVQADGAFHLIKLEQRIDPKAVKFEDVKQSIRTDLEERLTQAVMSRLRGEIGQEALKTLKVEEPTLRQQLGKRLESQQAQVRNRDQLREEFEKQRERLLRQSPEESEPTTAPAHELAPATQPATRPAGR